MRPVTPDMLERQRQRSAESLQRIAERGEPRRQGRRQSARTRQKLYVAMIERERRKAANDPNAHPLKVARLAAGLSWPALADKANVSVSQLARIERGEDVGRLTWARLAAALDLPVEAIHP